MPKDYSVGYGKPPAEHQFKTGKSGNPAGRPKGKKNVATTFHEITHELINITENGKARSVTKLHAIVLQMVNKAVSGDPKAAREILQWNGVFEQSMDKDAVGQPDREKDAAVLRSFLKRAPNVAQSEKEPPDES
jgi:hypothetical protein